MTFAKFSSLMGNRGIDLCHEHWSFVGIQKITYILITEKLNWMTWMDGKKETEEATERKEKHIILSQSWDFSLALLNIPHNSGQAYNSEHSLQSKNWNSRWKHINGSGTQSSSTHSMVLAPYAWLVLFKDHVVHTQGFLQDCFQLPKSTEIFC